jgi:LemA protein
MPALIIGLVTLGVILLWTAWTFNRLIRKRNGVDESWSTVDVELTRRHDLVPLLADAVRGYASHEAAVFERVATARSRALTGEATAETALTDALRSLFALVEAYPELKSAENFLSLQQQLETTEDRIAYARGLYNAWVTDYETVRRSLPSSAVAALFRFAAREFYEADVASRVSAEVDLRPSSAQGGTS